MDPILMQLFLEDEDDGEFEKILDNTSLPKSLISNDEDLIYKQIQSSCLDIAVGIGAVSCRKSNSYICDDGFNKYLTDKSVRKEKKLRLSKLQDEYIDSDVDDEEIKKLIRNRKKKKMDRNPNIPDPRERIMVIRLANPFEDKNDDEFFHFLRITRKTFGFLLDKLKDTGLFFETYSGGNFPVQAEQALQMFLYYMGQRCTYKFLSQMYSVSESAIMTSFIKCVDGINRLDNNEVVWPSDPEEARIIEQDFRSVAGFPGIIGSFGGCCIEMRTNKEPPAGYKIGKLKSIMYLLAVTDSHCKFTYIQAGFPGTFCLQEAFESSSLGKMMKLSSSSLFSDEHTFLVGDENLVLNPHLMVPFTNIEEQKLNRQLFNEKLMASNSSKQTFALLRSRFATFQGQIYSNLEKIPNIIKACCIIHNVSLRDSHDKDFINKELVDNFEDYAEFSDKTGFIPTYPDRETIIKRELIASQFTS